MEIHFASKGINNYIEVCGPDMEDKKSEYYSKLRMLQECDIDSLIKPADYMIDDMRYLNFPISGLYILDRYLCIKKPDGSFLDKLILELKKVINNLEKYMLDQNDLLINIEYILFDERKSTVKLIYVPGYNKDVRSQMKLLFEKLMIIFDHNDKLGVEKLYRLYHEIVCEDFSISKIVMDEGRINSLNGVALESKCNVDDALILQETYNEMDLIEDKSDETIDKKRSAKDIIKYGSMAITASALAFFFVKFFMFGGAKMEIYIIIGLIALLLIQIIFSVSDDRDDDEDLAMKEYELASSIRKTSANQDVKSTELVPYVPDNKNYDSVKGFMPLSNGVLNRIELLENTNEIIVGRSKIESDYCLDTTQISRKHAKIIKEGNMTYIVDNKSTNGTYVNSLRLEKDQKMAVNVGDVVRFANEDFVAL